MPTVAEVCRYVRSKNAGPYWITFDLFFAGHAAFNAYARAPALADTVLAQLFGVPAASIKRYYVPDLCVLKLSVPRRVPQGGISERDMHGGQQYVSLLDLELSSDAIYLSEDSS